MCSCSAESAVRDDKDSPPQPPEIVGEVKTWFDAFGAYAAKCDEYARQHGEAAHPADGGTLQCHTMTRST